MSGPCASPSAKKGDESSRRRGGLGRSSYLCKRRQPPVRPPLWRYMFADLCDMLFLQSRAGLRQRGSGWRRACVVWAAVCLLLPLCVHGQTRRVPTAGAGTMRQVRAAGAAWADSLSRLTRRFEEWRYAGADTLGNPYLFQLMLPPTLYDGTVRRAFSLRPPDEDGDGLLGMAPALGSVDGALRFAYGAMPWLVRTAEDTGTDVAAADSLRLELEEATRPDALLADGWEEDLQVDGAVDLLQLEETWDVVIRRPNFWKTNSSFSLQFMQNYLTDNWYKGGESYNSLQASLTTEANYDNKRKVIFNNKLEMKLGFQSSRNDDRHRYKTNSDQLRLTNKLGLRATDHWYYTFLLQSWTQFCRGYKSNDDNVYSDFMSPFESVFSIGMDYNLSVKNFTLTATMSPIACDFKYVGRKSLATSFGLKENHHTKWELGSNVTINYKWTVIKNVNWSGRIYYYTNYKKSQLEWENTIDLVINRFLTSRIFLYPRFDDSVARQEDGTYFQFNETLSIGLNVTF